MEKTWKPTTARILSIIARAMQMIGGIVVAVVGGTVGGLATIPIMPRIFGVIAIPIIILRLFNFDSLFNFSHLRGISPPNFCSCLIYQAQSPRNLQNLGLYLNSPLPKITNIIAGIPKKQTQKKEQINPVSAKRRSLLLRA